MAEKLAETEVKTEVGTPAEEVVDTPVDKKGKKSDKKAKNDKKAEKPLSPAKQTKLEKKSRKKEIKALRKEAKQHSLKCENRRIFGTRVLALILIIVMLAVTAVIGVSLKKTFNDSDTAVAESADTAVEGAESV